MKSAVAHSLPLSWQGILERTFNSAALAHASRDLAKAVIRESDVVFIPDAAWSYSASACTADAHSRGAMMVTMTHDLMPITHSPRVASRCDR